MTFRNGAELIRRGIAGGDIPSDFSIEEEDVLLRMQSLVPILIRKDFFESVMLEDWQMDATFFVSYKTEVVKEDGQYFAVLPSAPVFMYGKSNPEVFYTKDNTTRFTYIDQKKLRTFKNVSITKEISGVIFHYEHDNDDCNGMEHRLIFENIEAEAAGKQVKVRMICGSQMTDFDADTEIPPMIEDTLLKETRAWFVPQDARQADKVVNDRNDKV